MKLEEYKFYEKQGIYSAGSEFGISYTDGTSVERKIFNIIKNATDLSDGSAELTMAIDDWPTCYHFNVDRANIIKAFSFPKEFSVLEIGSGCGAVTRYLGENFSKVDVVEGSFQRALITRERCRDLENVRVFNSNVEFLEFDKNYDIVTLIGVLEYASVYFSGQKEKAPMLLIDKAKEGLKENGILFIAIENRLGIKYVLGSPEDHTNIVYEGIHGYPHELGPVTFSKYELQTLLKNAGFKNIKFFSCFPDYKTATAIINDDFYDRDFYFHNWIKTPTGNYIRCKNCPKIHESLFIKSLYEGKSLDNFGNSFVVLASMSDLSDFIGDWAVKRFSMKRTAKLRTITTFCPARNEVIKERACKNSANRSPVVIKSKDFELIHNTGREKWIQGNLAVFEIYEILVSKKDVEKRLKTLFGKYLKEMTNTYSTGSYDREGYPILYGKAFDFILRNLIRTPQGELKAIDLEWELTPITSEYVLYRCLIHDLLSRENEWIPHSFRNDNFIINFVKNFYPQYNSKRLAKNKKNGEGSFKINIRRR